MKAELHGLEALVHESVNVIDARLRRADLRGGAVDLDSRRVASPELVDGQPGSLPDDVPEWDFHAVDRRSKDLSVAQDRRQALNRQRVLTDEVRLNEAVDGHDRLRPGMGGADSRDAFVRLDLDQNHLQCGHVASAGPSRVKRCIERELDEACYDVRDQHDAAISACSLLRES